MKTLPALENSIPLVKPLVPDFEEISEQTKDIIARGALTKGKFLRRFEEAAAEHLQVKHALAVSSCTSGLMLVYQAFDLTAGEVIVPSFTFMATVSALVWAGAQPVFVDVDQTTGNLDPGLVEAAITTQTKAIVPVHIFGNPVNIEELEQIAARHKLKLIFDAAHAFGSKYRGVPVGGQGDAQIFSLSPTKLVVAGEGGIVATGDANLAERIRRGREYGNFGSYDSEFAGLNARMPEINALLAQKSLLKLEQAIENRNAAAAFYRENLKSLPGIGFQTVCDGNRHSYKDFSITIDAERFGLTRDRLAAALEKENVETRKYFAPPVHRQTAYRKFAGNIALPATEKLSAESLSLPMWSEMPESVLERVCAIIKSARE